MMERKLREGVLMWGMDLEIIWQEQDKRVRCEFNKLMIEHMYMYMCMGMGSNESNESVTIETNKITQTN